MVSRKYRMTKNKRNKRNKSRRITKRIKKKRIRNKKTNKYKKKVNSKYNRNLKLIQRGGDEEAIKALLMNEHETEGSSSKMRALSLNDFISESGNLVLEGDYKDDLKMTERIYYSTLVNEISTKCREYIESNSNPEIKRLLVSVDELDARRDELIRHLESIDLDFDLDFFKEYQEIITTYAYLMLVMGDLIGSGNAWENCNRGCLYILKSLVDEETKMTFYWIKYLNACLIKSSDDSKIHVNCVNRLTGNWEIDKKSILVSLHSQDAENNINGVIPVIGPSASGKTVWVVKLVKTLGESGMEIMNRLYGADEMLPHFSGAINIDGGVMREICDIGRAIIDSIRSQGGLTQGISNYHGKIFDTDDLKITFIDFLAFCKKIATAVSPRSGGKQGGNFVITLPDTTTKIANMTAKGNSAAFIDYLFKTLKINGITSKIPFCFYVYQHFDGGGRCSFNTYNYTIDNPINYRGVNYIMNNGGLACVGCRQSGEARATNEGKKYSGMSYNTSKRRSDQIWKGIGRALADFDAERLRKTNRDAERPRENTISFKIHNSGRSMEITDNPDYPDGLQVLDGLSVIESKIPDELTDELTDEVALFTEELNQEIDFIEEKDI